jgi:hypothetical protein
MAAPARRSPMSGLIGRDLAVARPQGRRLQALPFGVALAVLVALAIAGLHVDQMRIKLALGASMKEVARLEERQRQLLAEIQRLRAPAQLGEVAVQLGMAAPERSIDLAARGRRARALAPQRGTPAIASERIAAIGVAH